MTTPSTFNPQTYLDLNPDLKVAYGNDTQQALNHWNNWGQAENRNYGQADWSGQTDPHTYWANSNLSAPEIEHRISLGYARPETWESYGPESQFWKQLGGVNPTDPGWNDYYKRAENWSSTGSPEAQARLNDDDDFLGRLAPLLLAGAGMYFGMPGLSSLFGEAAGAGGLDAVSLAAGDSMAGMIPGSELGAWTGVEAGAGDWSNLGDLWNYGSSEASGGWTDSLSKMFSEMGFGNGPSTAARAASTAAGMGGESKSGFGWGDVKSALSLATPIMSIASGLYGMNEADELKKAAMASGERADPWGTSGGRALADSQLQELMRNPGQVAGRDPSYALRIQGAQRAMATQGQDSGAMSVAGANAATDWYNQRLGQLGGLAGAGVNPGNASQISMSGVTGANDLASKALASIGYGVTRGTGNTGMDLPPALLAQLRAQGYAI